ncbi:MAG: LutB/LldF family L-lactate oxidation iron-sulfur protein [Telluria sp.]|nr:LutB/LldF family L-lactate oxidation iron-sulfur protein [Telluria sp.]
MSQPIHFHAAEDFAVRSRAATGDPDLRRNFRGAMDFLQAKRRAQFPDAGELNLLRDLGQAIRRHALANLPDLLQQLESRLVANGVVVHWAETPAEANAVVLDIARRSGARRFVKGKSMVSEEVGLNHALEAAGIEALETDMGEYIVQLAGEAPSHIIMPAIHKTRQQIGELFAARLPGVAYTDNVDALIRIGREVLRRKFAEADIGISGVNFAVAETGTLFLVENEGNGRMCTTVPRIHIAITGIEKVVAKLEHVAALNSLLPRSATGQAVETYQNFISGPRKADELDGPDEVHLILLDNGRTQAYADLQLRATLQCIRCGACMNHCPVYARIGGHAYGTTYPGPIGAIISPHMLGLDATYPLAFASTLCGACVEVCPVRIPITDILIRLRNEAQARPGSSDASLRGSGAARTVLMSAIWRAWSLIYSRLRLYRLTSWFMSRGRALSPIDQGAWTRCRTPLIPAAKRLRDLIRERGP